MSSSLNGEEEDLIDLDDGAYVSPITVPEMPFDTMYEDHEHLLDVCPPKLEQKLSLTREDKLIRQNCNNGHILVQLGHDQVVPQRKRFDVVSVETIKRVRDITKNLEPVMKACERHLDNNDCDELDDTNSEDQVLSAFDFLTDMDDNEECNSTERDAAMEKSLIVSYPLEPICFIENNCKQYNDEIDKNDDDDDDLVWKENGIIDNYQYAQVAKHSKDDDVLSTDQMNSQTDAMVVDDDRQIANDDVGSVINYSSDGMESPINMDTDCTQPSTSNGIAGFARTIRQSKLPSSTSSSSECSEVDWSWVDELEYQRCSINNRSKSRITSTIIPTITTTTTITTTNLSRSSLSSGKSAFMTGGESEGRMRPSGSMPSSQHSNGSVAMYVDTTGKSWSNNVVSIATTSATASFGMFSQNQDTNTTTITTTTAVTATTSTTASTTYLNNNNNNNNNSINGDSPASSWLRASMRRLRRLRLPETERRPRTELINLSARQISAPNSLPDIALIAPEILAAHTNNNGTTISRPSSAPVVRINNVDTNNSTIVGTTRIVTPRRGRQSATRSRTISRTERSIRQNNESRSSSREYTSPVSCPDNNRSGASNSTTPTRTTQRTNLTRRVCNRQCSPRENDRSDDDQGEENPLGKWPHALSPALACLGCTLGLFNISRFAILSVQFGANFIVQFLVLTLILGIPLLTLDVCLGQRLAAGAVDMWKISPVFHGVGIALLVAHAFIGIYSIIGISWMFIYFRDSFITKQDRYRWAEPFLSYREDSKPINISVPYKLHETVPDYFNGVVLQRHHLNEPDPGLVTLKFQVAFNLAVVWMIVFVSLSKGLRSYGKVVYFFTLIPVIGTLILCTKLLGLTPPGAIHQLFPATVWSEFFINSKSWMAASSEVFLTWGLLGAAAMQIAAHNKHKHLLQRDTSLVIVLTIVVLLLAAFLANTCVQLLRFHGYIYTTSSFEKITSYVFMQPVNEPLPTGHSNTPERFMSHASFLLGQRVIRPGSDVTIESGYQALRLSTELVPATLAILGTDQVSPFWAVLFYFILILFGIAQQLAIWHCVITGIMAINAKIMKLWETTITFFSCACAYILGLPMATELGIYVVYYLDYTIGGAWWIIVLYLVQIGAVFAVRGRPHTGEAVVAELFPPTGTCLRHWAGPLLSFTWNVVLPVTLMVLSITLFRSSGFRDLYTYKRTNRDYWAIWAKQLGAALQLIPVLIIPAVAFIQTWRYLNNGPPDIFDRIQLLYRPSLEPDGTPIAQDQLRNNATTNVETNGISSINSHVPVEDPPPKYTPPPSYTTATGARIAKMLRQSFRRSVRRIASVLGETSAQRTRPALEPPPPDYATVLVEINQTILTADINEPQPDVTDTGYLPAIRPNTLDRTTRINTLSSRFPIERSNSTIERRLHNNNNNNNGLSNLTAADVASLLRSSIRRGTARTQQSFARNPLHNSPATGASAENLVCAAAPIGQDSPSSILTQNIPLVLEHDNNNDDDDDDSELNNDEQDKKTVQLDNDVSVI